MSRVKEAVAGGLPPREAGVSMWLRISLLPGFVLGMVMCGGGTAKNSEIPPAVQQTEAGKVVVTGVLEKTVEAGGWILNAPGKTYLLLSTAEYQKEPWFQEGSRVLVEGDEEPEAVTVFMQGTPFRVKKMSEVKGNSPQR